MKVVFHSCVCIHGWQKSAIKRSAKHFLIPIFLMLFVSSAFAQEPLTVTGKVLDTLGVGIPNVTVAEKGTQKRVLTNDEGAFSIVVASESSVLVLTSIGYIKEEIVVGNRRTIDIAMST